MSPLLLQSFTFVIDALAFPHIFFSFFIAHLIHGVYIFIAHLFFCFVYCPPHICLGVPRKLPKFPVTIQQGRWVLLPPSLQATHPPPLPVLTSQAFQVTAEIANFAPKTLELYSSGKERQNPLMLILFTFPPGIVQTETNAEKMGFSLFSPPLLHFAFSTLLLGRKLFSTSGDN